MADGGRRVATARGEHNATPRPCLTCAIPYDPSLKNEILSNDLLIFKYKFKYVSRCIPWEFTVIKSKETDA